MYSGNEELEIATFTTQKTVQCAIVFVLVYSFRGGTNYDVHSKSQIVQGNDWYGSR